MSEITGVQTCVNIFLFSPSASSLTLVWAAHSRSPLRQTHHPWTWPCRVHRLGRLLRCLDPHRNGRERFARLQRRPLKRLKNSPARQWQLCGWASTVTASKKNLSTTYQLNVKSNP
ncbi:hypothetical protein C8J57DRAFT_1730799 [Mycena rebaudengoi]|nr:hypothetical protein C8J57DRAFT_1730799 [Mycena rebaudengoi]